MAPATLTPSSTAADHPTTAHSKAAAGLIVGALGVVFGDIGTSPLYALRETFLHDASLAPTSEHVLGVLSVLFWAVTLTVTIKYVTLIMRADNKGEGGVLALATLATHGLNGGSRRIRQAITLLAVIGLALFYGDAIITPAVSVMGAVEGLSAVAPAFTPFVLPLALVVLVALFLLQARGTADVGRLFGPVMLVWFVVLGVLGAWQVAKNPAVLLAINPLYGYRIIADQGLGIFWAFGSIVLAVTGAEALYADMGHFGRKPIRIGWLGLVMPGLLLNYFGQGAMIIADPTIVPQLFFELVPKDYILALVALATLAAIIASQAVITGVFSLTRQAIQLGYLPRMEIQHTSETAIGQIYIPRVNWILMGGVVALVVGFGSSGALAGAYGIAVTGAMMVDAALATAVAILVWRWPWPLAVGVFGLLAVPDVAFFIANSLKIPDGGWLPLVVAAFIYFTITTWRHGRRFVAAELSEGALPLRQFLERMERVPNRVAGTAVFLTADASHTPAAFLHNLKHNKVLHERIIILQVETMDVPRVPEASRVECDRLGKGFWFISLSHSASATKTFFRIPPNRAIELGNQIQV
jgi:KUP system potassium uptake protein